MRREFRAWEEAGNGRTGSLAWTGRKWQEEGRALYHENSIGDRSKLFKQGVTLKKELWGHAARSQAWLMTYLPCMLGACRPCSEAELLLAACTSDFGECPRCGRA